LKFGTWHRCEIGLTRTSDRGTHFWQFTMTRMASVQQHIRLRACFYPRLTRPVTLASASQLPSSDETSENTSTKPQEKTHFKITLRRSAISLPKNIKGTLVSLGIHRRMQTVYHPHSPEVAGKILTVKELVEVENVPWEAVRTKLEQRLERRPPKGFQIVGSKLKDAV
jgi:large subunit ribosomal protein L30